MLDLEENMEASEMMIEWKFKCLSQKMEKYAAKERGEENLFRKAKAQNISATPRKQKLVELRTYLFKISKLFYYCQVYPVVSCKNPKILARHI